ncbi:MAG: gliding motility-associated C-terminal domain-containing protein, partial [Cyclobacteriaceae bacterium]|nr:gliding motility-associated C-terminal domain-containing protein [Cyclobacteriaceae bacterium]
TVERISCNGLTFRIIITVYTSTDDTTVKFSDGTLNFGDGSKPIQTPTVDNIIRPELGKGVGFVQYSVPPHTFPGPGYYVITYKERNRNTGILNMTDSKETQFFLETVIIVDSFIGCDNSPRLLVPPIDRGCTGKAWYHNPGAFDPDGDSLSYEFTNPKQDKNVSVNNYRDPNNREFYTKLNYSAANEDQNGSPTFSINPVTGTILWDAPGAAGEYNIAFRIIQWRKIGSSWRQIGYVTRDMQIVIEDCKNQRPELTVPSDICVEAGTSINEFIFGNDPDALDSLKIEAFSEVFSLTSSPATYTPFPARFQGRGRPVTLNFNWNTTCAHVKDQPYQVVFKISDKSKSGPSLVQFKTWRIRVVGPKPVWKSAALNLATRSANLEWQNYKCAANATKMEIWRRVDSFPGAVEPCVTGMPDSFGFTKIATVPIGTTKYTNTGLTSGAKYCYRLVAIFPLPRGGESIVSDEICLPPFKADRAVITNVTIDKTDEKNGQITVRWLPPFDIDETSFPPPYSYKVYRAEGFSGKIKLVETFPGTRQETFWVDTDINTRDIIYNYRILGFDKNGIKIDSSAVASSVRLEIKSKFKELELRWAADVPWSNNTFDFPTHTIYRGAEGQTESQLVKIADMNVNQNGFVFTDRDLNESQVYCYRVETRGSYGNPKISPPLVNFSQISCAQPSDDVPPCGVSLIPPKPEDIDCAKYFATTGCTTAKVFSNTLNWRKPLDRDCQADVSSYAIYYAARVGDEFKKLPDVVRDTFFVHTNNLLSFAGCYKITVVDRAGNESEPSESLSFDNCPYFELPNVFTPNGDKCNDTFREYNAQGIGEGGLTACGEKVLSPNQVKELETSCARFVEKVIFNVFNRWGGLVYRSETVRGGERTIYIDWDGRDNGGKELSTGTYYYEAQVTFDVVDPAKATQSLKGWVQLLR